MKKSMFVVLSSIIILSFLLSACNGGKSTSQDVPLTATPDALVIANAKISSLQTQIAQPSTTVVVQATAVSTAQSIVAPTQAPTDVPVIIPTFGGNFSVTDYGKGPGQLANPTNSTIINVSSSGSPYGHTGITDIPYTFVIHLDAGFVAVYGGYRVGARENGVYGTIEKPGDSKLIITNGFVSIVSSDTAQVEWDLRMNQGLDYCWAITFTDPGSLKMNVDVSTLNINVINACKPRVGNGAQAAPASTVTAPDSTKTAPQANTNDPIPTGKGKSKAFTKGTPVLGYAITLNDGKTFSNCYLASPADAGILTDGLLYPNTDQIKAIKACIPAPTATPGATLTIP